MKNQPTFYAVLVLALGISIFVYFYLVLPQAPFSWDESHHSTFSILIAKSILQQNWQAFWHYTNYQIYWPFLHSWISSIFLLVGGFSYQAARFTNVVIGFASIILIYQVGKKLGGNEKSASGVLAALLLAASPMFLFFSSTAMIENLGLFFVLLLILLQFSLDGRRKKRKYFITGLVLALLYLTKYIFAVFFGVALFCFWISLLIIPTPEIKKKNIFVSFVWTLIGFLIIWGLWFFIPPSTIASKFGVFLYRLKDTGGFNPLDFKEIDNWLFFIRALLYVYTFSIGIYLLYLGGLVFGLIKFNNSKIRLLSFVFLACFIPMSLISNSQERFIYVVTPALFLLTAAFIMESWRKLKRGKIVIVAVFGVLILGDIHKLPHYVREVGNASIAACAFKIHNEFNYTSLFGLWSYPEFLRFPKDHFNPTASGIIPEHNTEDVLDYILTNTDPRFPVCVPFYIGSLSPHLWHWHSIVKNRPIFTNWRPDSYYFVALEVDNDSPYFILWNSYLITGRTRQWDLFLSDLQSKGLMEVIDRKYFPDMGLGIKIYRKSMPLKNHVWRKITFP